MSTFLKIRYIISKGWTRGKNNCPEQRVTLALLKPTVLTMKPGRNLHGHAHKALGMVKIDLKLLQIAQKFRPDILIGVHNPYVAHVGTLLRKPVIIFYWYGKCQDRQPPYLSLRNTIIIPAFPGEDRSRKACENPGNKRNAYLHPNYFFTWSKSTGRNRSSSPVRNSSSWGLFHGEHPMIPIFTGSEKERKKNWSKNYPRMENFYHLWKTAGRGSWTILPAGVPWEDSFPPLICPAVYRWRRYHGCRIRYFGDPRNSYWSHCFRTGNPVKVVVNFLELRDKYGLIYFYPTEEKALQKALEIYKTPIRRKSGRTSKKSSGQR